MNINKVASGNLELKRHNVKYGTFLENNRG
jgi:hypothetical protein